MRRLMVAIAAAVAAALILGVAWAGADSPTLTIEDASDVSYTSAEAKGTVDPQGKETNCHFEYVSQGQLEENLTNGFAEFEFAPWAECDGNPHEGSGPQDVEAELSELAPASVYHLRLVASNEDGQSEAVAANTFETEAVAKPSVSIDPVTTFTGTTAHFTGQINPNAPSGEPAGKPDAFDVHWHFECTPECPGLSEETLEAAGTSQPVQADAAGLEPNTDYEVKLIASNAGGSEEAGPVSFKTLATGPTATTFPAFALGSGSEALIGGKVNPRNSPTEYWVEYGPGSGSSYPNSLPTTKDASVGSGGQAVFVTQKITGLTPASNYHYRLVAKNATGETQGEDVSFETPAPAEPIQTNCPNAKIRTETSSAALPECRAYEMTTEPDKIGFDAYAAQTTSADGNRMVYFSASGFGDAQSNNAASSYLAKRAASGWTTQSLTPAVGSPNVGFNGAYFPVDPSADLSAAVLTEDYVTSEEPTVGNILLLKPGVAPTWVTAPTVPGAQLFNKFYAGRSADASHVFFESPQEYVPGAGNGQNQIWEWFDGQVHLVSAQEDDSPFPAGAATGAGLNAVFSTGYNGTLPQPTAVSADGSRVFFSQHASGFCVGTSYCGVYVREDGEHTRPISVSQRTGSVGEFDSSARFLAAAADGSRAYLLSEELLTNDATPGGGLYSYNLETDTMHFLGNAESNGIGITFKAVPLVSEDGTRAYFISREVLVPGKGVEGAPNLYTANADGGDLAFVGTVEPNDFSYVKATPDGGKFVFDSTARLTAYNNGGHREIYSYNADDDSLRCISCRPDGQAAEGDANLGSLLEGGGGNETGRPRALSSDGESVFFETSDGLVPEDANGLGDVYKYRDGQVYLISTGTSAFRSQIVDNSPDGKNVFFITRDALVGQDIDGNRDIYDARVDGGFPAPPPPVSLCEGEACQGQAHGAPTYVSPGTASLVGRGNTDGRTKKRTHASCRRKSKKHHSKCKKTKKHKSKKQQAKKASKSGRGE